MRANVLLSEANNMTLFMNLNYVYIVCLSHSLACACACVVMSETVPAIRETILWVNNLSVANERGFVYALFL